MKLGIVPLKSVWRELSNDIHFTMVYTCKKNHEKSMVYISSMYRLGVFIEFCYLNVWLKTNYIPFKSPPHAERNGTSHSFIPPTTAVKKQKAPRKHPTKLMYCAVYHTGKVVWSWELYHWNQCDESFQTISISQWFTLVKKIMKKAWSMLVVCTD